MKLERLSYYYHRHHCYVLAYLSRLLSAMAAVVRALSDVVRA